MSRHRGVYLRDQMTIASLARWLAYRVVKKLFGISISPVAHLQLASGVHIYVRENSDDANTAHEVFVAKHYDRSSIEITPGALIVDLGANVGYSTIDFCKRWPNCRVLACEPIPEHVDMIRKHVSANKLEQQVEVLAAAAATISGRGILKVDGVSSHITERRSLAASGLEIKPEAPGQIVVDLVDILARLQSEKQIDLLKMDIEGSEFLILQDHRFKTLNITFLVVEWHFLDGVKFPKNYCESLLKNAGYAILEHVDNPPFGMFYCRGK